jgi:two-component system response regulator PilR (NtrC family)
MSGESQRKLLVIDDEPDLLTLYELTLLREGYQVDSAGTVAEGWARLAETGYDAVITDMRLPDGNGLDLLRQLEASGRRERVIVITAYGSAESAVEALKAGAFDFLTKPVDLRQFRAVVAGAIGEVEAAPPTRAAGRGAEQRSDRTDRAEPAFRGTRGRAERSAIEADTATALQRLVGESAAIRQLRSMIERVSRGMAPVLLQGESGTGKELVARAIHEVSARAGKAFVAVNCGAIPEQLLEAEFFGVRRGAYTGANEDRAGFFQAAQGGTLLLDEIGDLPLLMQSKLLRALQERMIRPLGATAEIAIDTRIISATHKDLALEVQAGRFRQDLFYRLNVIQVRVPPLRERLADLPAICDGLLARIAAESGDAVAPQLSIDALGRLARYHFPGNVRELQNLLHRALALSDGEAIAPDDLDLDDELRPTSPSDLTLHIAPDPAASAAAAAPVELEATGDAVDSAGIDPMAADAAAATAATPATPAPLPNDLSAYLDAVEREILVRALDLHRFNRTAAGASLGLSLRQMRYRMARLGVRIADHFGERGEADS